jgi:hypothetical protein
VEHVDITEVSDAHLLTVGAPAEHPAPEFRIVKGEPTDEELAAVVTVLAAAAGATPAPGPQELNLWGHPVDKLRYTWCSWQAVTLRDRMHIRR